MCFLGHLTHLGDALPVTSMGQSGFVYFGAKQTASVMRKFSVSRHFLYEMDRVKDSQTKVLKSGLPALTGQKIFFFAKIGLLSYVITRTTAF